MNQVAFIGSASGWGAQVRETEKGPDALANSGVLDSLPSSWLWKETIHAKKTAHEINLPNGILTAPYIEDVCKRVAQSVNDSLEKKQFPIIIGGDHSVAIGTWAGVTNHYNAAQKFGLIWIDAHMDAHTPETSLSQAYHGMPLAVLLGSGDPSLLNIASQTPMYSPEHVCLIGVRSFEDGEANLLNSIGVRIFDIGEVEKRGFQTVLKEALSIVKKGTLGFGLTIDLDAFDPSDAPGVGSPEPFGLNAQEVLSALSIIQQDPDFKVLEIVEYNPILDKENKTLLLMRDLIMNLIPEGRNSL